MNMQIVIHPHPAPAFPFAFLKTGVPPPDQAGVRSRQTSTHSAPLI